MSYTKEQRALAKHLDMKPSELYKEEQDYLVLSDADADELCAEYIKDSVWAFNASFLAAHCGIDEEAIKAIQANNRCDDNNEIFLKLIDDFEHFVSDAVASDGRGHFLSSYDGEEHEVIIGKTTYYIYRIN